MGLVLCYMYLKSDSILVTMLAHAGNNFLALMSVYSNHVLITVLVLALVIYGLITMVLKSKEINEFIKEEKTNENWYARFFKRIPNLLYLVFTILWNHHFIIHEYVLKRGHLLYWKCPLFVIFL